MGDKTKIGWTATHHPDGTITEGATLNPIKGTKGRWSCVKIRAGCKNCYAAEFNKRLGGPDYTVGADTPRWDPTVLDQARKWKRPRKIFLPSMSDLFWDLVPDEWVIQTFRLMLEVDRHIYIITTKRAARMLEFVERFLRSNDAIWPKTGHHIGDEIPPHIWLGSTVENQRAAESELPIMCQLPAATRWLSLEPMLTPIDLTPILRGTYDTAPLFHKGRTPGIDWVVAGGESGRSDKTRWMVEPCPGFTSKAAHANCPRCHGTGYVPLASALASARDLRDACAAAGVPFYWKQWGGPSPVAAGRLLDGVLHDGFPAFTGYDPLEYP